MAKRQRTLTERLAELERRWSSGDALAPGEALQLCIESGIHRGLWPPWIEGAVLKVSATLKGSAPQKETAVVAKRGRGRPASLGVRDVASFACALYDGGGLSMREAAEGAARHLRAVEGPRTASAGAHFQRDFGVDNVLSLMRKIRRGAEQPRAFSPGMIAKARRALDLT